MSGVSKRGSDYSDRVGDRADLDLLRLEMDTLWGADLYGRPKRAHPLVALAVSEGGRVVRFGTYALGEPVDLEPNQGPSVLEVERPPEIEIYRKRFESMDLGATLVFGGPSFVVSEGSLLAPPTPPHLEIFAADRTTASALAPVRPKDWWEPQEWADLVAGRLGPCAIGLVAGRVETLCHTSAASAAAAEAGVWTHPEARERGYGTAITAAWARLAAPSFGTLFYSTGAENVGSRGIARRLRLRPIGRIWQVRREA